MVETACHKIKEKLGKIQQKLFSLPEALEREDKTKNSSITLCPLAKGCFLANYWQLSFQLWLTKSLTCSHLKD